MSIHFHTLTVTHIRKETDDCISIAFDVPESLKQEFIFQQGQNITIRKIIEGEELRRNYSICSSPSQNELRVAIKRMPNGKFSNWANEHLREGDSLDVLPPTGKFNTKLDPSAQKHYLAFVAGSGITPVMSILKATLETEPQSRFTLVYGNKSRRSIIFREELEELKNRYMQRLQLIHLLSQEEPDSPLNFGRIDADKCHQLTRGLIQLSGIDEVFICGPEAMIHAVRNTLEASGFPSAHIHFELFTTPGAAAAKQAARESRASATGSMARIKVKIDGVVTQFTLPQEGDSILNAALRAGADLPFACKGGMCATCKAKLLEGKVEMDVNYALEAEELKQGYILTCQSHPLTETVFVDFDQR
jgi:ring-1,2-phenylacetyl-CoA epoxidase subunit PaaE